MRMAPPDIGIGTQAPGSRLQAPGSGSSGSGERGTATIHLIWLHCWAVSVWVLCCAHTLSLRHAPSCASLRDVSARGGVGWGRGVSCGHGWAFTLLRSPLYHTVARKWDWPTFLPLGCRLACWPATHTHKHSLLSQSRIFHITPPRPTLVGPRAADHPPLSLLASPSPQHGCPPVFLSALVLGPKENDRLCRSKDSPAAGVMPCGLFVAFRLCRSLS